VANRFVAGAEWGRDRDHCAWRIICGEALRAQLYSRDFARRLQGADPLDAYAACMQEVPASREPLARLLHADTAFYLPNDMLVKVDRMSMAHGLEVRVPFLDIDMVRYCASLPGEFKLRRGRIRKHILRESLRPHIPKDVLDRPKSGFNIPVSRWMRSSLQGFLWDTVGRRRDALSAFIDIPGLRNVGEAHDERRADHGHVLFTVLMLAMWMDNAASAWRLPPDGRTDSLSIQLGHAGDAPAHQPA
jgi:asparagine synthase (glutamine-hydrolysing)